MTDWIEHTGDTCPVEPETVVEVLPRATIMMEAAKAGVFGPRWRRGGKSSITHYRIITAAKNPEPEMTKPEPDLITLRLECLKLAFEAVHVSHPDDWTKFADDLLHYVLNGSVDKA
jgi:hypothetical protein